MGFKSIGNDIESLIVFCRFTHCVCMYAHRPELGRKREVKAAQCGAVKAVDATLAGHAEREYDPFPRVVQQPLQDVTLPPQLVIHQAAAERTANTRLNMTNLGHKCIKHVLCVPSPWLLIMCSGKGSVNARRKKRVVTR